MRSQRKVVVVEQRAMTISIQSCKRRTVPRIRLTCNIKAVVELATTSSVVRELVDPIIDPRRVPNTFLGDDSAKDEEDEDDLNVVVAVVESEDGIVTSSILTASESEASPDDDVG